MDGCPSGSPGGIDAEFLCLLQRLGALLAGRGGRPGEPVPPETMAAWLVLIGSILLMTSLLVKVARDGVAWLSRRRRSATMRAYWPCLSCRALNPLSAAQCYSCGKPRHEPSDANEERPLVVELPAPEDEAEFGRG